MTQGVGNYASHSSDFERMLISVTLHMLYYRYI